MQNKILKEIAVALGATVTYKDNDTNELLGLIRDNLPTGGAGGGSKLYKHDLVVNIYDDNTNIKSKALISIITNFDTVLSDNNFVSVLGNYYSFAENGYKLVLHTDLNTGLSEDHEYKVYMLKDSLSGWQLRTDHYKKWSTGSTSWSNTTYTNMLNLDGSNSFGAEQVIASDVVTPL